MAIDSTQLNDARFMARALVLARRGRNAVTPNPAVGCVLVKDDAVIGEGWHQRAGEAHAEIHALNDVKTDPAGATAYVTLEPCSHQGRTGPCTTALIEAKLGRVVIAMQDPNPQVSGQGLAQLQQAGIDTDVGLLAGDAEKLNRGYCRRMRDGRPGVRLKIGASLDGRTAAADGTSQWITGQAARADVQQLRGESCAILTGIETVLADDPRLTVRSPEGARQPLRVVLDSRWRMPATSQLIQQEGNCLVLGLDGEGAESRAFLVQSGAECQPLGGEGGRVDLPAALRLLAERGCNEVLVEAGATLSGAMIQAGLVDELILYTAPDLLGQEARAMAELPAVTALEQRIAWRIIEQRRIGRDLRTILAPA